jgi:hypothetical protein
MLSSESINTLLYPHDAIAITMIRGATTSVRKVLGNPLLAKEKIISTTLQFSFFPDNFPISFPISA